MTQTSDPETGFLDQLGQRVRTMRAVRGMSRKVLAKVSGISERYIAQLEAGRGRIPPDRYLHWAEALGVEPRYFVRTLLRYYDPVTYAILFGDDDVREREPPAIRPVSRTST